MTNGRIDPELADAAWERNRDSRQASKLAGDPPAHDGAGDPQRGHRRPEEVGRRQGSRKPPLPSGAGALTVWTRCSGAATMR
jgi:hypothetical protein